MDRVASQPDKQHAPRATTFRKPHPPATCNQQADEAMAMPSEPARPPICSAILPDSPSMLLPSAEDSSMIQRTLASHSASGGISHCVSDEDRPQLKIKAQSLKHRKHILQAATDAPRSAGIFLGSAGPSTFSQNNMTKSHQVAQPLQCLQSGRGQQAIPDTEDATTDFNVHASPPADPGIDYNQQASPDPELESMSMRLLLNLREASLSWSNNPQSRKCSTDVDLAYLELGSFVQCERETNKDYQGIGKQFLQIADIVDTINTMGFMMSLPKLVGEMRHLMDGIIARSSFKPEGCSPATHPAGASAGASSAAAASKPQADRTSAISASSAMIRKPVARQCSSVGQAPAAPSERALMRDLQVVREGYAGSASEATAPEAVEKMRQALRQVAVAKSEAQRRTGNPDQDADEDAYKEAATTAGTTVDCLKMCHLQMVEYLQSEADQESARRAASEEKLACEARAAEHVRRQEAEEQALANANELMRCVLHKGQASNI